MIGWKLIPYYRKSSIKPPGEAYFFKHFWGGPNREGGLKEGGGGLFYLVKRINGTAGFLEDGLVVPGRYTAFSNNKNKW